MRKTRTFELCWCKITIGEDGGKGGVGSADKQILAALLQQCLAGISKSRAVGCKHAGDLFSLGEYIAITIENHCHAYLQSPHFHGGIADAAFLGLLHASGLPYCGACSCTYISTTRVIFRKTRLTSADMHLTTSIDFFFNEESMKVLNRHIDNSASLDFLDVSEDESYELALRNMLTEDEYVKYQNDLAMGGSNKKLPQPLQVRFLFSRIDFDWDNVNSAFLSQRTLPLIICNSKQVYKSVPGRIVIEKKGSRNRLYIYFEFDNEFFFFQFENNSMYGYASPKTWP